MAQPYASYPPGNYYAPGYDYSTYYQQQQAYDPNQQAYWQQQQQYYASAQQPPPVQQQPQQAPQPPQAPPLPADDPPPLPPDEPPSAQAGAPVADAATQGGQPHDAAAAAAATAGATAAGTPAQPQQQAMQAMPDGSSAPYRPYSAHAPSYTQYAAQHDAYYSGHSGGYGAPPQYGVSAGYGYAAYGAYVPPSANFSYALQVPQQSSTPHPPSTQFPHAQQQGSAGGAANTAKQTGNWNRAPPPASLSAGFQHNGHNRPNAIKPSTMVVGSTATANARAGAGASESAPQNTLNPVQVAAAITAAAKAAAVAARLTGTTSAAGDSSPPHHQQQQYISVAQQPTESSQRGPLDLPASFHQYVQRALLRAGSNKVLQDKLKEKLKALIAEHRKAGTMFSVDWDRAALPELDAPAYAASPAFGTAGAPRSSVFDRMASPSANQQGWDRHAESRSRRDRSDAAGDEDGYRGSGYKGLQSHRSWGSDKYQEGSPSSGRGSRHQGSKRAWDDDRYADSGSVSDDERSDSYDRDVHSFWGKGASGGSKWGQGGKKKQRLELEEGGAGRGRGRGKKQKQEAGKGRGRGRGNNAQSAADAARAAARSARFGGNAAGLQMAAYGWEDDDHQVDGGFIVGTSQTLEKCYLRLTRPPLPEEVRPQPVLALALQRLLGMITSKADKYLYYNDQFKAMRQDLTVQGIKNEFTVQVYEAHARAALEYGDNAEYNQCQAQLAILYAKGLQGSHAEFGAYRLLYQAVYAQHGEGRKLLGTLRQLLGNRVGAVAGAPEVQHAMQVRHALACGNVLRFFKLYSSAPLLSRRLMDAAVKQLRFKALSALVRSHKPTLIQLSFLSTSLGFTSHQQVEAQHTQAAAAADAQQLQEYLGALTVDSAGVLLPGCSEQRCLGENMPLQDVQQGLAACLAWCKRHGAVFDQESDLSTSSLVTKDCWNKLFVPVDTSKVAHGDANLDIRDFLAAN